MACLRDHLTTSEVLNMVAISKVLHHLDHGSPKDNLGFKEDISKAAINKVHLLALLVHGNHKASPAIRVAHNLLILTSIHLNILLTSNPHTEEAAVTGVATRLDPHGREIGLPERFFDDKNQCQ